jgi:F0F1-type ATP synthase epsilon subunit
MPNFRLQINTPDELVFDNEVESISLVTSQGQMTYLAQHWDSIAQLEVGTVEIKFGNQTEVYAINGGVATFKDNEMVISTIESQKILGRKPDLTLFPKSIALKKAKIQEDIQKALEEGGEYTQQELEQTSSLLAEERLAKVQILNEILKG